MTNLADIKRKVRRLEPGLTETHERFKTYLVMLASTVVGPNIKRIATYTGLTRDDVAKRSRNLRTNQVWQGASVPTDWTNPRLASKAIREDVVAAERR
jgi:hypothetical protein